MHGMMKQGIAVIAALTSMATTAYADDAAVPSSPTTAAITPARPMAIPSPPHRPAFSATAGQDDARLERLRGGSDPVWNDMKLNGTVATNTAQNVVTGANTIGGGAFANAVGLPTVIQNSGANVLIQNATIVNVQIR
jgi:hypothetical protein